MPGVLSSWLGTGLHLLQKNMSVHALKANLHDDGGNEAVSGNCAALRVFDKEKNVSRRFSKREY